MSWSLRNEWSWRGFAAHIGILFWAYGIVDVPLHRYFTLLSFLSRASQDLAAHPELWDAPAAISPAALAVMEEWTAIARQHLACSGVDDRIDLRIGPAQERLRELPAEPHLDLAFIDADKENYPVYYEEIMTRMRLGGLIVIDNALWSGRVLDPKDADSKGVARLNEIIREGYDRAGVVRASPSGPGVTFYAPGPRLDDLAAALAASPSQSKPPTAPASASCQRHPNRAAGGSSASRSRSLPAPGCWRGCGRGHAGTDGGTHSRRGPHCDGDLHGGRTVDRLVVPAGADRLDPSVDHRDEAIGGAGEVVRRKAGKSGK